MRHFDYLDPVWREALFAREPQAFDAGSPRRLLATALGATLYTPGTRLDYAAKAVKLVGIGVASAVLCLEDAVSDSDVAAAESNVIDQIAALHRQGGPAPLVFVRVRHPDQVSRIVKELDVGVESLAGFVFPKFTARRGRDYLEALAEARASVARPLYGLPVLESAETMFAERRLRELTAVRSLLGEFADAVLGVRIGATDLCGLFGLRRGRELTVYDLAVVREAIADIVNVFCRDDEFAVFGPVWEYYSSGERLFKPQLRQSPFDQRIDLPRASAIRRGLISRDLDGLMREVVLDKATGLIGKTVIHPSHVRPVHALYAVNAEEFADAQAVLADTGGGAKASPFAQNMIESRPHRRWAELTVRRAQVYGVLRPERSAVDLLDTVEIEIPDGEKRRPGTLGRL